MRARGMFALSRTMRKAAILSLFLLLGACGRETPERTNVLLLVVDTCAPTA